MTACLPSERAGDADRAAFLERLDAVVDRVLEQRLQDQRRHLRVHRQAVELPVHFQPIAEPQALDPLVGARDLDLVRQRDAFAMLAQRCAEQVGEVRDRLLGGRGLLRVSEAIVFMLLNRKCGRMRACSARTRLCASASTLLRH